MLQQKYTKLLEERIAQLELLVKNGSSVTANHDTDAEASKVKSNGTSSSNKEVGEFSRVVPCPAHSSHSELMHTLGPGRTAKG